MEELYGLIDSEYIREKLERLLKQFLDIEEKRGKVVKRMIKNQIFDKKER